MSRMRQTERTITGTPAENRAVQAGLKATNAALNKGKSRVEAKKIGADAADKAMKGSRSKFNKQFAMLAASAIGGVGVAAASRGLGTAGKALVKALQSQKRAVTPKVKKATKIAKIALGQGEKGRRSGVALRDKKTGKLEGVSKKDQAIAKNLRTAAKGAAATAGIAGLTTIAKKPKKEAQAAPPAPKRKPSVPKTKTKQTSFIDEPEVNLLPKETKSKKDEAMSFGKMVKGAVGLRGKEGLEGKKRLVKTPFGNVTFDTSDSAFEEPEEYKAGGRVKRNMGGKVRGVGQAVKGFGNATYSNKPI